MYYFYVNTTTLVDFQICNSVPLITLQNILPKVPVLGHLIAFSKSIYLITLLEKMSLWE